MSLGLFRALIPRWNFFDQISSRLELWFKNSSDTEWKRFSFDQRRTLKSLLINPDGNMALLHYVTLEHLATRLGSGEADPKELSSYKIIRSLISSAVPGAFQFKILVVNGSSIEELYVSEVFEGGMR